MPRSCRFVDDPMESGFESAASPKIHVFSQIHNQQSFFRIGNWNGDPNPLNMVCHLVDGLKRRLIQYYVIWKGSYCYVDFIKVIDVLLQTDT